jgi:triosephosphate isomerase
MLEKFIILAILEQIWKKIIVFKQIKYLTKFKSISDVNATELIKKEDIDGFLIGCASLEPAFHTTVEACNDENKN